MRTGTNRISNNDFVFAELLNIPKFFETELVGYHLLLIISFHCMSVLKHLFLKDLYLRAGI